MVAPSSSLITPRNVPRDCCATTTTRDRRRIRAVPMTCRNTLLETFIIEEPYFSVLSEPLSALLTASLCQIEFHPDHLPDSVHRVSLAAVGQPAYSAGFLLLR